MKIGVLTRNPRGHSMRRLREVALERGHKIQMLDTLQFSIHVERQHPALKYRSKPVKNYDVIIPRIGASVTFFGTAVLRQFEQMGVFTPNSSQSINVSRDKLRSLQVLSRHDIGITPSAFVRNKEDVMPAIEEVGGAPVIIKLLEGTQGIGVILADSANVAAAIIEKLDAKQKLFADLEAQMKPGAVLATNTSSLRIEDIAQSLNDPGRLIGLHFFNPVAQMPLVEVVKGEQSRQEEVEKGAAFVTAISKMPLIVKSCPGFLVNRVLAPYLLGSIGRYQEGMPKEKLDAAAEKFGMPMGPIELADVVGLDVCMNVNETLGSGASKDNDLARLVSAGKLGKKTGEGFYKWEKGKAQKAEANYDASELERLGEEMLKPLIDECERALEDGIVANADLVDAGVIFGTGFAPFRGGPLHYRRSQSKTSESTAQAA